MISIAIDTNIINSGSKDFTIAQFLNKLDDIVRFFESNDNYQDVKILLPKIVIQELFQHQLVRYYDTINSLRGLKLPNSDFISDEDYNERLTRIFDEAIENLSQRNLLTEVIDYPKDAVLPEIIKRALEKRAPFEGKDKESDKGFKDVILWESILEYKRQHTDEKLILYTKDNRLCEESLKKEYDELFHDEIFLMKQTNDNDYSTLFGQISKLQENKENQEPITSTFDEENKLRVLNLINDDNISPLFEGWPIEVEEGSYICSYVRITNKSISNIADYPSEKKVRYVVNIDLSIHSSDEEHGIMLWDDTAELTVDYYFDDDIFYLQQASGFNGDWEYEEKDYQLLE